MTKSFMNSTEVKNKINTIVQNAFKKHLSGAVDTLAHVESFFAEICQDSRALAFDESIEVQSIACNENTLILEFCLLDKTASVFLQCFVRHHKVFCALYSTIDDYQVEILKSMTLFDKEYDDIELFKMKEQLIALQNENENLRQKLATYNCSTLVSDIEKLLESIKKTDLS